MILLVVILLTILLVLVASVMIDVPTQTKYELERRRNGGDAAAEKLLLKRAYVAKLLSIQRLLLSFLLVIVVALCVLEWGWLLGVLIALLIALEYGAVARMRSIHSFAQKYYDAVEYRIIETLQAYPIIAKITETVTTPIRDNAFDSRDELLHLVSQSGVVLTHDEKMLIRHALEFDTRSVRDTMTPRSVVDTIARKELLGPLVLDQLHKTGHSRFPVIDGDIDHVVGTLYLRDVLKIDATKKHTSRVDTAMDEKVFYIHEDQTLDHALAAFLKSHHHLFIVVNEYRETVGILSLEDVVEQLLGKKIIDEFDTHDDLRAVASRNPRANNRTKSSQDV